MRFHERTDRVGIERTQTRSGRADSPWWKDKGLRKLNFLLLFPLLSFYVTGYDAPLTGDFQMLQRWQEDFHYPHGTILSLITAVYFIGSIVGVVAIYLLPDRIGRKKTIIVGSMLCVIGTALTTGAQDIPMFIVGRIQLGIGGVVVGAIGPVLLSELAYPSHRATATAMTSTTYSLGAFVASWVTFGSFHLVNTSWAWRLPAILQGLPSVLQIIGMILLPESPRFLLSKGRRAEALRILADYHGGGDAQDKLVQFEYNEIKETIELEQNAQKDSVKALFNSRGSIWRTFILFFAAITTQCSGQGMLYFFMSPMLALLGITSQTDTTLIASTSQLVGFLFAVAFAFLPARLGRRRLMLWSLGLIWIVFAVITAMTGAAVQLHNTAAPYVFVVFIYLFFASVSLGWLGAVFLYIVEILPYSMRTKGLAWFWFWHSASGAFNTYVNPLGLEKWGWYWYIAYVIWIFIEFVVVYIFFIETKGTTLEQVAVLFDGKSATVSIMNPVVKETLFTGDPRKRRSQALDNDKNKLLELSVSEKSFGEEMTGQTTRVVTPNLTPFPERNSIDSHTGGLFDRGPTKDEDVYTYVAFIQRHTEYLNRHIEYLTRYADFTSRHDV